MADISKRRAALNDRLKELEDRLLQIDEDLDSHTTKDWEELAVEREEDEVLEGMGLSAQAEIRMIKAALQRMDEGEYGYCVECGDKISEERLDILPYTPFCAKCAAKHT
ncbi:TraR/DksA family transcriptional regulator [Profundibacter sp.]|uniref:TraR/DksA family transcriptional regulator n=1 Tax=Profundibacter sp. TaxID=3101071 RepID=UPI003D13AAA9